MTTEIQSQAIHNTRSSRGRGTTIASRGRGTAHRSNMTRNQRVIHHTPRDHDTHSDGGSSNFRPDNDDEDDFNDENEDDLNDINTENLHDLQSMRARPPPPKRHRSDITLPTLQNYHELGIIWGKARAEEVLAAQPRTHNRPSAIGLFEAQGLQAQYDLDKTMLSLALKCSRRTLDESLMEGPLALEPNSYTNYQTYSNIATKTAMPPKGTSNGFKDRNVIVGNTWSAYTDDQQMVFTPKYFEKLARASQESLAPPLASTSTNSQDQSPIPPDEPLEQDKIDKYLPIFKELVNLSKLSRDFKEGHLVRHAGNQSTREKVMKGEIKKIVRQLQVLHQKYKLEFHLLLGCWNPNNPGARALFEDEYTSCEEWAVNERKNQKLLECFVHSATHAPLSIRSQQNQKKTLSPAALIQQKLRKELSDALNGLVLSHLSGESHGRGDSHPKCANPHLALSTKTYRGEIKLSVVLSPDCKIDASVLAKGPSSLSDKATRDWLDDIEKGRYRVVKANTPLSQDNSGSGSRDDGIAQE